ncbi:chaperone protein dnaJ 8, chloroplastic-like [Oryza glaberrima]|uniref:J domain-containing protein n=1 Tax=Oryza glaberrima TaxID=4538 RepID=I1Q460_ORYGL|nr:chaperone protein dnaJ 8, chloroplastic-like [Oryza glaberrima]
MAAGGMLCVSSSPTASASVARGRRQRRRSVEVRCSSVAAAGPGGPVEEHYRTLRLPPGATKGEVKRAFRRLALTYHPDVSKESDSGVHFQRINVAYQMVMGNMREAEERLEYWRLKYGLDDEDLDKYRNHLNDEDDDEWFDV